MDFKGHDLAVLISADMEKSMGEIYETEWSKNPSHPYLMILRAYGNTGGPTLSLEEIKLFDPYLEANCYNVLIRPDGRRSIRRLTPVSPRAISFANVAMVAIMRDETSRQASVGYTPRLDTATYYLRSLLQYAISQAKNEPSQRRPHHTVTGAPSHTL